MLACITKNGNLDSLGFAQLRFLVKIVRFPKRFTIISYPEGRNFQFGESRKGVMMVGLGLSVDLVGVVIWVGF